MTKFFKNTFRPLLMRKANKRGKGKATRRRVCCLYRALFVSALAIFWWPPSLWLFFQNHGHYRRSGEQISVRHFSWPCHHQPIATSIVNLGTASPHLTKVGSVAGYVEAALRVSKCRRYWFCLAQSRHRASV